MKNTGKSPTTSKAVVDTLQQLREALKEEYGCDFSFEIFGRGHVVAASNRRFGEVWPEAKELNECEACKGQPVPGVLSHQLYGEGDTAGGVEYVDAERCDRCRIFQSDEAACEAYTNYKKSRNPS